MIETVRVVLLSRVVSGCDSRCSLPGRGRIVVVVVVVVVFFFFSEGANKAGG
jgi:hypothetical protein